ncbi:MULTISPECIES: helix-turn-helix domain-containing protein [Roseomonadaceae]|uniref:Helix-turn-helix domain-containing protein n=1 Tax=Falsiroseomonas oleicola TaxID=2801474 RepID=A0ABS6H922_9PROT|nr:hypothetical protein [Roseomonas oleicola]MBU8543971.1 hypothetical protein [Roseomonas oleicola]
MTPATHRLATLRRLYDGAPDAARHYLGAALIGAELIAETLPADPAPSLATMRALFVASAPPPPAPAALGPTDMHDATCVVLPAEAGPSAASILANALNITGAQMAADLAAADHTTLPSAPPAAPAPAAESPPPEAETAHAACTAEGGIGQSPPAEPSPHGRGAAGGSPAGRGSAPPKPRPAPMDSPRRTGTTWTEARRAILTARYPAGDPIQDITAAINAEPGPTVTAKRAGIQAAKMGLRRPATPPPARARPEPVSKAPGTARPSPAPKPPKAEAPPPAILPKDVAEAREMMRNSSCDHEKLAQWFGWAPPDAKRIAAELLDEIASADRDKAPAAAPPARPEHGRHGTGRRADLPAEHPDKAEARAMFAGGGTARDIAADFGIPLATVSTWIAEWRLLARTAGAA